MNLFGNLKLDKWWAIVLYLGLLMIVASLLFHPAFLQEKHAFGLGIGLIMIGLSFFMAQKVATQVAYGGLLSIPIIKHNVGSIIVLIIGICLTAIFGFLIVKGLLV